MPSITSIHAREIIDSRGNPTVEADVTVGNIRETAAAPSGASTGKYEAKELRDGGARFRGKGVLRAVRNIEKAIAPLLTGIEVTNQREIDSLLIEKDGTKDKSTLGGNAITAVSLACAKAAAASQNLYLFEYFSQLLAREGIDVKLRLREEKHKGKMPRPIFNLINGGKHAGNTLPFQEFWIVPQASSFSQNLQIGVEVDKALRTILLRKYGKSAVNVGDEGGFAPPAGTPEKALQMLLEAARKAGHAREVEFGMDCAASVLYEKGRYRLFGKRMNKEQLLHYYLHLIKKYKIYFLEDPFEQDDFASFAALQRQSGITVIGDDLTVSNAARVEKALRQGSISGVILKVNQVGTLTEALDTVRVAYGNKCKIIVSHRSGETEDSWIADLAVGIGAGFIKAGAPVRGERTAKYNRLLRMGEVLQA